MDNINAQKKLSRELLLVLVLSAVIAGIYWTVRYAGWSMEVDAARQTASAGGIVATGRLVNDRAYVNGYAYGVALAFVSAVGGVSVQSAQLASGLWLFLVVLTAFVAYRELLGDAAAGALATLFLLVQPDFLFYVLRGSHEKMTWSFGLLMLFLLARSYRLVHNPVRLAVYVALFYFCFFAMAASNAYFASTFLTAIIISFAGGWIVRRLRRRGLTQAGPQDAILDRLMMVALVCSVIVYTFVAYLYPPAFKYFWFLQQLVNRLTKLLGTSEITGPPASYGYLETAWRSGEAYALLTGVQWLIAAAGLLAWLVMARTRRAYEQGRWLLWLMYTGFGVQIAYGMLADYTHMLSDNMQLRLFTPLALFTAPLAAGMVADLLRRLTGRWRLLVAALVTPVAAFALVVTLLKVTNDPSFGNQWLFYAPSELRAAQWADDNIRGRRVWVDTTQHLDQAFDFQRGYGAAETNIYTVGQNLEANDYVLLSELIRLRASRAGITLPTTVGDDQIYDNGVAQLYHPRQHTPYQR